MKILDSNKRRLRPFLNKSWNKSLSKNIFVKLLTTVLEITIL